MHKLLFTILICLPASLTGAQEGLHIHLLHQPVVETDTVRLEQVALIAGAKELVEKVKSLALGTFSAAGQVLQIDRQTILSRLASAQIESSLVSFSGATQVQVRRNETVFESEILNQLAREYLESQFDANHKPAVVLARSAKRAAFSADLNCHVKPVFSQVQTGGVHLVRIGFFSADKPVGYQDVLFSVRYPRKQLVANHDLAAGTILSSDNTTIQEVLSDSPPSPNWTPPYGQVLSQRVPSGGLITPSMLRTKQPEIVVRKRQPVLVKIENAQLYVSAVGEALDDGAVGQIVRVKRGQKPDERIITCRVLADGSVEPVF